MIVLKHVLKVCQSSRQSSYTFAFHNGYCDMCKKKNLSPSSLLNKEKNEEIKPDFEGLYFTTALGNLAKIWYVGMLKVEDVCSVKK